jgi:hypothetical protein
MSVRKSPRAPGLEGLVSEPLETARPTSVRDPSGNHPETRVALGQPIG